MNIFIEIIGWFGMAIVLLAYTLVSHGKIKGQDLSYQYLNIFGALSIGVHVYYKESWPLLALQIVWIIIAVSAISKARKQK